MIDLLSQVPVVYWTYELFDDLKTGRKKWGFGDNVWRRDEIDSMTSAPDSIAFDPAEDWQIDGAVRLNRESDGVYRDNSVEPFEAVRTDTATHVILTGNWFHQDGLKGTFIAVFPKSR